MKKTILIPIDFRVASLNTLKLALEPYSEDVIEVILLYAEYLGDSITELLFYTPKKIVSTHITPEFKEALEIIRNRFEGKLKYINIELFHGYTTSAMKNFLEANAVDEIYIAKNYQLKESKNSFDPTPFLKKSHYKVIEVSIENDFDRTEHEQLVALFN